MLNGGNRIKMRIIGSKRKNLIPKVKAMGGKMKTKQPVMLPMLLTWLLSLPLMMCVSESTSDKYDVIIKSTKIVDGSGQASFKGDIAIKGEKIVAVGKVKGETQTVIDGSGLITCPGFIDPHTHAEEGILQYPLAENFIVQGITTVIAGNCGFSPAPSKNLTFDGWLSKMEETDISINIAQLVGHNQIRTLVMGDDWKRDATNAETEQMKIHVEEAMRSGAFGLSSGIDAPWPGFFASMEEKIELTKIVAQYGGYYVPHTRHIRSHWPTQNLEEYSYVLYYGPLEDVWVGTYRGYLEAIEVSGRAGVPLHIAHFGPAFKIPQPHPDFLEEAAARATLTEIIDKAREEGIDVTFDVIPSPISIGGKSPLIREFLTDRFSYPDWLSKLDKEALIEKLKTQEFRSDIRKMYDTGRIKFGMVHPKEDPYWTECFEILNCKQRKYEGKTISEISLMEDADPLEVIINLLVEDPETTWVQHLDKRGTSAAILILLKSPVGMPCTDVESRPLELDTKNEQLPGPGTYGMFANYLGTYVRDKATLTLEEAIKKATGFPAQRFGLKDRGIIKAGAYADIIIFDIDTIKMKGDFNDPAQPPEGIHYVMVNGKVVYRDMAHTGEKPGKILRNK
jgi:N-acyl-D-amino-acid deacylase